MANTSDTDGDDWAVRRTDVDLPPQWLTEDGSWATSATAQRFRVQADALARALDVPIGTTGRAALLFDYLRAAGGVGGIGGMAVQMEQIADYLETAIPAFRAIQETLPKLSEPAARRAGVEDAIASGEQFGAAASDGLGVTRVEVARARIARAVQDPIDEISR